MRIDVVSIFPDYLAPLDLSLVGRARESGLLDVRVHDLRDWTHDRHRTVDDTPYGGGAGMVMRPEPWGEALDALVPVDTQSSDRPGPTPTLVVPTPAGRPFTQTVAERLAQQPWLLFACGRYEGIDQRVVDHAATRMPVEELSLGDYVLGGGEVAVAGDHRGGGAAAAGLPRQPRLAARRVAPHRRGRRAARAPRLHQAGELAGPRRPEVLLSGHHGNIEAWRHEQQLRRTRDRRPDLLVLISLRAGGVAGLWVGARPVRLPQGTGPHRSGPPTREHPVRG